MDENEQVITNPLIDKDELAATFVNLKSAEAQTNDEAFLALREQRIRAVEDKYAELEDQFYAEREQALADAEALEASSGEAALDAKAALEDKEADLKAQLAEAKETYREANKEIKARYKELMKEKVAEVNQMYKDMKANEKADYQHAMEVNKDPESRRARKREYQSFKESFPLMKNNDMESKVNSVDFEKETELNAAKAHYTQARNLIKSEIEQGRKEYMEQFEPVKVKTAEYKAREEELRDKKDDELLHAELLFFFKYDNVYQVIPDDITTKIIQGLGSKVFTKVFRVCVPHDAFIEDEKGSDFKVVSLVNYGDVQLYKCVGEAYGEKVVVYVKKEREMEIGEIIHLLPDLTKTEIYETQLNIRLY